MRKLSQERAPIYEALERFKKMRVVPFDVPGHKRGRGNPELTALLGENCVQMDVNSMKPLDNLCHPISVIRDAEVLAAEAFHAAHAFLMVGGTTSAVQSMILSVVKRGEKIILPRNVHRSVMGALVLCGAIPIYVNPACDEKLGIPLGMSVSDVKKAIEKHPDAKAVLVNNPTYYGICSDLRSIVKLAHEHNMLCLADEAHGTHFYFGENLPVSAMDAGADMAAVSMHKSGGSLTQSSLLLAGPAMTEGHIRQIINLTQTTSGSYLLLSSLDISRRNLALRGKESFARVVDLAEYARAEINAIGGYYAYSKELINGDSIFDFDVTKLSVNTLNIGLAGIEVYDLLRDEYDIQIEFGDLGNILAYISIGDRIREIERLVSALYEVRRRFSKSKSDLMSHEYIDPQVAVSPQEAFYAPKESLEIEKTAGRVCSEFVMCYPPGIPILAPGERITEEILRYIAYAKEKGCSMTGPEDAGICITLVQNLKGKIPILGVCLGHQAIAAAFGGEVTYAEQLMHGKTSFLTDTEDSILFRGIERPIQVARYHSLAVRESSLPAKLRVTARTDSGEVMALEHREYPIWGVQFHPESVMTPEGFRMIRNLLEAGKDRAGGRKKQEEER